MNWFRRRIRQGSGLALLAMVLQLALSFGHTHGDAQAATAQVIAAQTAPAADIQSQPAIVDRADAPSADHSGSKQLPVDVCAICAVMALATSVVTAAPPVLHLPEAAHFLYLTTDAEFNHLDSQRAVFQPRAPPAS